MYRNRPVAPQPEEEEFQEEQWADDRMEMPEDSHPKTTDFAPSSHDLRKKEDWERQVRRNKCAQFNRHPPAIPFSTILS